MGCEPLLEAQAQVLAARELFPQTGGEGVQDQQLGVAVTTSFMPTGQSAGSAVESDNGLVHVRSDSPTDAAAGLIQFSAFSSTVADIFGGAVPGVGGKAMNYGVAPDFACGHQMYLPPWVSKSRESPGYTYVDHSGTTRERPTPPGFFFVDRNSRPDGLAGYLSEPGFFIAIYQEEEGGFGLLEALDTWLHANVTFEEFKAGVLENNWSVRIRSNIPAYYITRNGNLLHFVVWNAAERAHATFGAQVLNITYGTGDPQDAVNDAGNARTDPPLFLYGTVLKSSGEAVVEISNVFLSGTLRLDMSDPARPRRTSETGDLEEAGSNHEVWQDFDWSGLSEGDVCQPFNTIAGATAAVAAGGAIKIIPGSTGDPSAYRAPPWRLP